MEMESYRVGGISGGSLPPAYLAHECPSRPVSSGPGRYGLSIRVQGIGGHPYVVLNNREREPSPCKELESNGHSADGDPAEQYGQDRYTPPWEQHPDDSLVEYRSHKQMLFAGSHNGVTEFQESQKKPSTLLNFQRHPELLRPYDPENNSLNLEDLPVLTPRPASLSETGSLPCSQLTRGMSPSLDKPGTSATPVYQDRFPQQSEAQVQSLPRRHAPSPDRPAFQVQPETQEMLLPEPTPQSRQPVRPEAQVQQKPQLETQVQSPPHQQAKPQKPVQPTPQDQQKPQTEAAALAPSAPDAGQQARVAPPASTSTGSSLERSRRKPDVLLLRRHDSSGPVLQSQHSSHSSSSPSSTSRPLLGDPLESLGSDPINRHQNRRYIPFMPGTGRDIDTGSIKAVEELIDKFDGKEGLQRRGRAGRRNRINPEERKRSRSVDSAFPFGIRGDTDYLEEFSKNQGRSTEHVLRPSQLRQLKGALAQDFSGPTSPPRGKDGASAVARGRSAPGSPQGTALHSASSALGCRTAVSRSSTLPLESKGGDEPKSIRSFKVLTGMAAASPAVSMISSSKKNEADNPVTPDLLKDQQTLSQQTNEETAKQILFNYLKDGNPDNDDTTKRKVNLVFEKIQTLKSRAAGNVQGDNNPPEAASEVKALQDQKNQLEKEVTVLKKQLEEETKTAGPTEVQENAGMRDLRMELVRSMEECARLQELLSKAEEELRTTMEELFQVKMEKEKHQTEIRDLQDQLSEMHDELDGAKRSESEGGEQEDVLEEMMQLKLDFQELLQVKEEQEELLRRRERELTALKGALKEEVATHDKEVDTLREQYEEEIRKLLSCVEDAKQNNVSVCREKQEVEAAKGVAESRVERLSLETERLRRRVQELENEVAKLNRIIDESKLQEGRLTDHMRHLEKENSLLGDSLAEVREQEEAMSRANRALTTRLEDVQRNLTKLTQDHKDLNEKLKEERIQKEQFKRTKDEIEDERRLLDRTVEKLQKEMCDMVEASQTSTQDLQVQIDEYKEKNRRELAELQRQLQERGVELENSRMATRKLQEEVSHLEEDLKQCKKERDEAVLREKKLELKVFDLEVELENVSHSKQDRPRYSKITEDRITQLEMDLEEERNNGDLLMDRIEQGRKQVEEMRNELLQERAMRQDLECDKVALERQNKDLKSRVTHLEGSQKSNKESLVSQLEGRIQELEERLEGEERDRANLQLVNRKLERKVKELMIQVDDEHTALQDQKDQLHLRLKALKRQIHEAEEEIERQEHGKKKLQRELEEQLEANEQLQGQILGLRNEMRRKNTTAPSLKDLDDNDDDMSTDGEIYYRSASGYKRSNHNPIS
nr:cingulin-like protein 1 isoform X2 [Paramormyrops kingsleyae]